jgi:hypothetical protein
MPICATIDNRERSCLGSCFGCLLSGSLLQMGSDSDHVGFVGTYTGLSETRPVLGQTVYGSRTTRSATPPRS